MGRPVAMFCAFLCFSSRAPTRCSRVLVGQRNTCAARRPASTAFTPQWGSVAATVRSTLPLWGNDSGWSRDT